MATENRGSNRCSREWRRGISTHGTWPEYNQSACGIQGHRYFTYRWQKCYFGCIRIEKFSREIKSCALSTYTWNACCITTGFLHENKCPSLETYLEVFEWCAPIKGNVCRTQALVTGSSHMGDETMEECRMKVVRPERHSPHVPNLECGIVLSDDAVPISQSMYSHLDTLSHWRLVKFLTYWCQSLLLTILWM